MLKNSKAMTPLRKGANSKVRRTFIFICNITNMESSNYKMGSMFNFKKYLEKI